MESILKEGGEARKYAVALQGAENGEQLVEQLMNHSGHMEKLYGMFKKVLSKEGTKDSHYEKLIELAKEKMAWFEKTKAWLERHFQPKQGVFG